MDTLWQLTAIRGWEVLARAIKQQFSETPVFLFTTEQRTRWTAELAVIEMSQISPDIPAVCCGARICVQGFRGSPRGLVVGMLSCFFTGDVHTMPCNRTDSGGEARVSFDTATS